MTSQRSGLEFMRRALALAEEALLTWGEFPIAALVVLDGRIIAGATTTEQRERRFLGHAELRALEEADRLGLTMPERRRTALYTNLEPCLMCAGAAMSFFLGQVYFSLESPADGALSLLRQWERKGEDMPNYLVPRITGGLLRAESARLFGRYVALSRPGPMRDWAQSLADLGLDSVDGSNVSLE